VVVLLDHTVPPVWLGDGVATRQHRERRISVVPQKKPYFLPPVRWTGRQEVKIGINYTPRFDEDVHAAQNRHFRARALPESDVEEVVPLIEVRLDAHVGLTQGHKGHYVQDPQGGQVMQLQAIKLQQRVEKLVRWRTKSPLIECCACHDVSPPPPVGTRDAGSSGT
jgi:hypothetical protein